MRMKKTFLKKVISIVLCAALLLTLLVTLLPDSVLAASPGPYHHATDMDI